MKNKYQAAALIFVIAVGAWGLWSWRRASLAPALETVPVAKEKTGMTVQNWEIQSPFEMVDLATERMPTPSTLTLGQRIVTIGLPPNDILHQNRNPGFSVYIEDQKIGDISGHDWSMPKVSPDEKNLAMRVHSIMGCGGTCYDFSLSVVNFDSGTITNVDPLKDTAYENASSEFIESYDWLGSNVLRMVAFYVDGDFRVSEKQTWDYDVTTQAYILVK